MPHYDVEPSPGYPEDLGLLLATLEDGTREWRGELGEPTPAHIVWQPFPQGHSIGALLLHIADVEVYWIEKVCLGREVDPEELKVYLGHETDQDAVKWPIPPTEPLGYYYDLLDRVRARTLESVKAFEASKTVKATQWGTMTLRWVLAHVVEHESYHGGQAVLLHEIAKRQA